MTYQGYTILYGQYAEVSRELFDDDTVGEIVATQLNFEDRGWYVVLKDGEPVHDDRCGSLGEAKQGVDGLRSR